MIVTAISISCGAVEWDNMKARRDQETLEMGQETYRSERVETARGLGASDKSF